MIQETASKDNVLFIMLLYGLKNLIQA